MNVMHTGNLTLDDRKLAILVDPDKVDEQRIHQLFSAPGIEEVNYILVGGSLLFNNLEHTLELIRKQTKLPLILFPGSAFQISSNADAIMLLNLISGRNPDFLIGHHVVAAPMLKKCNLPVLSTGYMLFDCGKPTSVQYMSNTAPLPDHKPDLAVATALAGEMIGMRQLYLEAGSGAEHPVPDNIIKQVTDAVQIPVIVGGGVRTAQQARTIWNAGANMLVVGNGIERNPGFIADLVKTRNELSLSS